MTHTSAVASRVRGAAGADGRADSHTVLVAVDMAAPTKEGGGPEGPPPLGWCKPGAGLRRDNDRRAALLAPDGGGGEQPELGPGPDHRTADGRGHTQHGRDQRRPRGGDRGAAGLLLVLRVV